MKLIILYGYVGNEHNGKSQNLIEGRLTCGYREYAKKFGSIIYMTPQNVYQDWEHVMLKRSDVIDFCNEHSDAIVFCVKPHPEKEKILKEIKNFKIYYSCNARNCISENSDVNFVDTPGRIRANNYYLQIKGKDPDYWCPTEEEKKYDYILMGKRNDKNQSTFIDKLTEEVKDVRNVLWIGGSKFKTHSHHNVEYTDPIGPDQIRKLIPLAKVGILYSEIKTEGFPQTFLEMTMSGVPVVYKGPHNDSYFSLNTNVIMPNKKILIDSAEEFLNKWNPEVSERCRKFAIENYSLDKWIERMEILKNEWKR